MPKATQPSRPDSRHSDLEPRPSDLEPRISDLETELIAFFVNAAQAVGLPKSVGEIYGLYFASEDPLALDDVVEKLQISKGSASQGIRFLRSIHALNPVYLPGDRRDHFTAETSLRRIADGFIRQRIRPELKDGVQRLQELGKASKRSDSGESVSNFTVSRIDTIAAWTKKADLLFPVVSKFLGAADAFRKPTL